MKTLVYFASGRYREEYQNLDYEQIILIDNCFIKFRAANTTKGEIYPQNIKTIGKVTCLGIDCLESIKHLKKEGIKIDCFVSINEGLNEGGGSYAINSDSFLGYVMPLLKDNYIHIMNPYYYPTNIYKVSMDLPYKKEEIAENEKGYIRPSTFSDYRSRQGPTKVYQMTRILNRQDVNISSNIKLSIEHDSIWNHYDELDLIVLSIKRQGQNNFFDNINKTFNLDQSSIEEVMKFCKENKLKKIGLTPWAKGKYDSFINLIENYKGEYPKEITLYHLNHGDYKKIKQYVDNKIKMTTP